MEDIHESLPFGTAVAHAVAQTKNIKYKEVKDQGQTGLVGSCRECRLNVDSLYALHDRRSAQLIVALVDLAGMRP